MEAIRGRGNGDARGKMGAVGKLSVGPQSVQEGSPYLQAGGQDILVLLVLEPGMYCVLLHRMPVNTRSEGLQRGRQYLPGPTGHATVTLCPLAPRKVTSTGAPVPFPVFLWLGS